MILQKPIPYVLAGAFGYCALRTGAAFAALVAVPLAGILAVAAFAWVITLLVLAIKRRHRTVSQATGDFISALGLGYFASGVATTTVRVRIDATQTLRAMWPLMLGGTLVAMAICGVISALIIYVARRSIPARVPPAQAA